MALVGKSNEEKIWNYLKSKGLNDYGCSGLMGNLNAESALNSSNLQNTYETKLGYSDDQYVKAVDNGTYANFVYDSAGFGLAQWTWWSRKKALYDYIKSKNKSIGDLEAQLEFLYKELSESYNSVLTTLKTAKSVKEASNAVLLKFECPADQGVAVQNKRASYGQKYYDKYANGGSKEGESVMGVKTYQENSKVQLSKNFNSYEFRCGLGSPCACSTILIDDKLVEYLQKIRDHFGKSVSITSAYRCESYNKRIGGATGSYHSKGMAADIVVSGVSPTEVAKYAESIGILGIGLYNTSSDGYFVHIDTRTTKSFWYGQAQVYRSTFGGISEIANTNVPVSTNINSGAVANANSDYVVNKTYKTQVLLAVRSGAGTNYAKKTYSQLSSNARINATSDGYLKQGTSVTCLEVKKAGDDIWIRIPSGWCAAYYKGEYYIK
jgi:hypothetical protein